MHSHKNKLTLFNKSNRSQASLLASQDLRSYQASPIDSDTQSPLHSPAFPPLASTVSSLDPDDREDSVGVGLPSDPDPSRYYPNHLPPRRTQSQRTPPAQISSFALPNPTQPTISPVRSPRGSAATGTGTGIATATTRIDEDPDSYYYHQNNPAPVKTEQKKKRRFFGFGESSTSTNSNPPKGVGRSQSTRKSVTEQSSPSSAESPNQQRWPLTSNSITYPPPPAYIEEEEGAAIGSPYAYFSSSTPPIPPKNVRRPSQSSTSSPDQERSHIQIDTQTITTAPASQSGDYPGSYRNPTWDRAARPPVHHQSSATEHSAQYQPYQSVPASVSSASIRPISVKGQVPPEFAYSQPQFGQTSRPSSQQSYEPPSPGLVAGQYHQRTSSLQAPPEGILMAPPAQPHATSRSSQSSQQSSLQATREGAGYQPYTQIQNGNSSNGITAQYGSQLGVNDQQSGTHRGTLQPSPMVAQGNSEQGRSTPPPSRSRDDLTAHDAPGLAAKYDELNEKYRKVKKYYFDKDAQVQQLQNTLAHQRLAQSRTSLDDNEYANRFMRLDGAINNLAFNIRKDWRAVPYWLAPHVNKEATTSITKEMTAVGRSCISRWLVDEILDRFFHPSLEPNLSCQLKIIEKNLRRYAPPTPTDEEKEALLAKISGWRLSTLDGLQDMLATSEASQFRNDLTEDLVKGLTTSLMTNLKEPAPIGLEAGITGIVELAVGIAANLPLESRDVYVNYVMPGTLYTESYMKVEASLPALTNPGERSDDPADMASVDSADEKDEDRESARDVSTQAQQQQQAMQAAQQQQQQQQQPKKKGMFGGLMTSSKKSSSSSSSSTPPGSSRGGPAPDTQPQTPKEDRVRFAAFMAVEVRGRHTLVKAPVYI